MIQIQYRPFSIHIEGHAGYAEKGKDIVCSASSVLLYTLEIALDRYESLGKCNTYKTAYPGYAHISAEPMTTEDDEIFEAFEIIADGYELLSNQYPDYVKFMRA